MESNLVLLDQNTHYPTIFYSLRPIILFASVDVSIHILVVDTSILMNSNMDRREYLISMCSKETEVIVSMQVLDL
jgi:hypothetical protein